MLERHAGLAKTNAIEKLSLEAAVANRRARADRYDQITERIADHGRAIEDAPAKVDIRTGADAIYLLDVLERSTGPSPGTVAAQVRTLVAARFAALECWLESRRVRVAPSVALELTRFRGRFAA